MENVGLTTNSNKIVAYGCSFTFGEELDDLPDWFNDKSDKRNYMPDKLIYHKPSKKSWPYVMGDILGYEVENYGWSGGSNDRIFRMIFEHIFNNDKKSTYVVQWTFPHRTEVWSEENQYYIGLVPTLIDSHIDCKRYYKHYYDEIDTRNKLRRFIWSVDSVCKQLGHEIIQFMPIGVEDLNWDGVQVDNKFTPLNNLPDSFLDTNTIREKVNYKIHPTEDGHRELAKYIINYRRK